MSLSVDDFARIEARIQPTLITVLRETRSMPGAAADPGTYVKQQYDSESVC
jgi:hypothetical protein